MTPIRYVRLLPSERAKKLGRYPSFLADSTTRCRVSSGKRVASGTSLRIIEIVVRDRPSCSANFLSVIRWPESAFNSRLDAVDFIGFGRIRGQRITSASWVLTNAPG